MQNIIVAVFDVESEGYQAITTLRQFPGEERSMISQAVLVKKEGGEIRTLDGFDTGVETMNDSLTGGLIGAAVGILGGPIGMLLGGSLGYMTGANLDMLDAIDNASMLEQIAGKMQDGTVALVILADEEEEAIIDSRFAGMNAVIARFDAAVIAEEVETAREMQAEMARQARVALRKEKTEEFKGKVEAQRDKIKEQFKSLRKKEG